MVATGCSYFIKWTKLSLASPSYRNGAGTTIAARNVLSLNRLGLMTAYWLYKQTMILRRPCILVAMNNMIGVHALSKQNSCWVGSFEL